VERLLFSHTNHIISCTTSVYTVNIKKNCPASCRLYYIAQFLFNSIGSLSVVYFNPLVISNIGLDWIGLDS